MRYFKVLLFQALLLSLVLFAANSALADSDCVGTTTSCSFTLDNTGVPGGPYVNVTVTLNGTGDATITFTAINGAGIVDGSSLALNVNVTSPGNLPWGGTYTNLTSDGESLAVACDLCLVGTKVGAGVDGFGRFNLIFDQPNASTPASTVSVELTGGWWTSASQVLAGNGGGNSAASHVTVNGCTFYVGDGVTKSPASCATSVPEPSVYLGLLSSGLMGLALVRRKWLH